MFYKITAQKLCWLHKSFPAVRTQKLGDFSAHVRGSSTRETTLTVTSLTGVQDSTSGGEGVSVQGLWDWET
jgi:hypothetical protein